MDYFQKEISKVENILRGDFNSVEERMVWENKLLDLKQKQYNAIENQKVINKAGYTGNKYWG